MAMTLLGDVTPREVIHKHESHKLHQAFSVTVNQTIYKGEMCYLQPDGTITSWRAGTEPAGIYIGIAVTDSITPAYPGNLQEPLEVTVAVRGFIVLLGEASAAIAGATWVAPTGRSTTVSSVNTWAEDASVTGQGRACALFPVDANEIVQILVFN